MEAKLYNQEGKEKGTVTLPDSIFGLPWNSDLVHQVVVSMTSSARRGTAHAKTRGEVRGGGKKPWQQKGTGQARHGSTRSPIWVGGGVTHGPRKDKNYDRKINRKMKAKALFTILSRKMRDGEVIFVDDLKLKDAKTKHAVELLSNFKKVNGFEKVFGNKTNSVLVTLGERNDLLLRSFRNIGNITMDEVRNINPVSLLNHRGLVVVHPEASMRSLEGRGGMSGERLQTEEKQEKPKKETKRAKVLAKKKSPTKPSKLKAKS
jgi:large subunit ribosomal protein L4